MEQICNLVYFMLTDGKTAVQKAELDVLLSPPEDKDEMLAKQNAAAMKQLEGMGLPLPMRPRKPKAAE